MTDIKLLRVILTAYALTFIQVMLLVPFVVGVIDLWHLLVLGSRLFATEWTEERYLAVALFIGLAILLEGVKWQWLKLTSIKYETTHKIT